MAHFWRSIFVAFSENLICNTEEKTSPPFLRPVQSVQGWKNACFYQPWVEILHDSAKNYHLTAQKPSFNNISRWFTVFFSVFLLVMIKISKTGRFDEDCAYPGESRDW